MPEGAAPAPSAPKPEDDRLRAENARLNKMVQALMNRAERSTSVQGSEFSLFQTAVMLEDKIRARTRELEAALHENERITRALHAAKAQLAELLEAERDLRLQHQRSERKFRLIFENAVSAAVSVSPSALIAARLSTRSCNAPIRRCTRPRALASRSIALRSQWFSKLCRMG